MQEMMNKTKWTNKEDRYKTENVVNAFVNTNLNYLHWMSPSVIGVLDTTNPLDATFKSLKSDERVHLRKIDTEETVFSIVDKLVKIFVAIYKDKSWEFCHEFPFMVPKDLWAQTTQEDYVYVKCAVGLLNELRILWRNEKHPDNIMEKKDPCENHITITQTGRIIEELFFNLEVPYISTWGDETSESSAERVRNNDNCNGNGRIPDYRLRVIVPLKGTKRLEILVAESCRETADKNKILSDKEKMIRMLKDAYERLERELADDTVADIHSEIKKRFTKINLFAIQPIGYTKFDLFVFDLVSGVFYRLRRFTTLSIPFSPSHAEKVEPFIMTLLKFRHAICKSATEIAGIAEAIRRDRKELYSIIANNCERTRILPRFTTPSTPPHD